MKIPEMFRVVRNAANYTNIEGVIIGSCSVGNNINDFISTTKNSRIAWIFGYTCEISWMASTLIDVSIFEHLMKLKKSDLANRKKILNAFIKALRRFNGNYALCKSKGKTIALKDAITLVRTSRVAREARRRMKQNTCLKILGGIKNKDLMVICCGTVSSAGYRLRKYFFFGFVENFFHNTQPPLLRHQSPMGDGAKCDDAGTWNTTQSQPGMPKRRGRRQELPEPPRALW